jgi:hypothetical protein
MEEKKEGMSIPISYSGSFVLFDGDHKKTSFNCFNLQADVLNRRADYIVFTIKTNTLYAIIVELKKTDDPRPQLDLTEYLVEYMIGRIQYKYKTKMKLVIRKVGLFKSLPSMYKRLCKPGKMYNSENCAFVDTKDFKLGQFL